MSLLRWLLTVLAFPAGGLLATSVTNAADEPWGRMPAAAVAGLVIGLAQWLALRPAAGPAWALGTTLAVIAGAIASWLLWGAPVSLAAAGATGAVSGLLVGAAQAVAMRWSAVRSLWWIVAVALAWAGGWVITSLVIVDLDRGYVVFGASGALFATVLTGVVLRRIMGPRPRPAAAGDDGPDAAEVAR